jgi:hypothetical protein
MAAAHDEKPTFPPAVVTVEYAGQRWTHTLGPTGEYSVGRHPASDLCIPDDPAVSRRHLMLFAHAGCLRLLALPEAKPVFVNGAPVTDRFLADRDIVRLGDTVLYIHYRALDGDPTTDPTGLRTGPPRRTTSGPRDVGRAVLTLCERYGLLFGRLQRTELDDELGQLLGVSSARARHRLDELFDELRRARRLDDVGRGTKRYVAVADALGADGGT